VVRDAAEISAGGLGDFGAIVGRKQPEDVQQGAPEFAMEKDCREATVGEHQRKESEPSLVVGDLGVVHVAETALSAHLVLSFINTITYYLPFLPPPCYVRLGRALICHEEARTRSFLPKKSEGSWNDAAINIRYHILLWRGPR